MAAHSRPTTGLILGKFMPPHRGHQYLVDFGRNYVDELNVLVCSIASEPIPGRLRYGWMRELYPTVNVINVTDEVPQAPEEHPDFWPIWRSLIRRYVPGPIDYVFASEPYGWRLGAELGAEYVPVDHARALVPVSGTDIRRSPMKYWNYIPPCVKPHFVKRVCLIGPESTGKSTLTRQLAAHYQTTYAAEYARGLLDFKNGRCDYEDLERIARGQSASERALAAYANRVMFSDTDPLLTTIWAQVLFQRCPQAVQVAAQRTYDLYLLLDVDVPWVDDSQRFLPHRRIEFFDRCRAALEDNNRPYQIIRGPWDMRFSTATAAVDHLISAGPPPA